MHHDQCCLKEWSQVSQIPEQYQYIFFRPGNILLSSQVTTSTNAVCFHWIWHTSSSIFSTTENNQCGILLNEWPNWSECVVLSLNFKTDHLKLKSNKISISHCCLRPVSRWAVGTPALWLGFITPAKNTHLQMGLTCPTTGGLQAALTERRAANRVAQFKRRPAVRPQGS